MYFFARKIWNPTDNGCLVLTAGLFNVGNKLLVSLDLLFAIRNHIKLGEDPRVAVGNILDSVQEQTGGFSVLSFTVTLSPNCGLQVIVRLYKGKTPILVWHVSVKLLPKPNSTSVTGSL